MSKSPFFVAAFMAAFTMGAANAQDSTNSPSAAVSQNGGDAMPSTDASGYGGTRSVGLWVNDRVGRPAARLRRTSVILQSVQGWAVAR